MLIDGGQLGKIELVVDGDHRYRVASVNVYHALRFLVDKKSQQIPNALQIDEKLRPFYGDITLDSEKITALHNFAREHAREIVDALANLFPEKAELTIIQE